MLVSSRGSTELDVPGCYFISNIVLGDVGDRGVPKSAPCPHALQGGEGEKYGGGHLLGYCTATRGQRRIKQAKTGTGRTVMIAVVDGQVACLGRARRLYRHLLTALSSQFLSHLSRVRLNGQKHHAGVDASHSHLPDVDRL